MPSFQFTELGLESVASSLLGAVSNPDLPLEQGVLNT